MKAIGLMSGTSADGADAALVDVSERNGRIKTRLIKFISKPFLKKLKQRVISVCEPEGGSAAEIAVLNVELGEFFARAALDVCKSAGVDMSDVFYIASHGQTVAHIPAKHATLQIGESAIIAERTGVPVISDFRQADLAVGGQGAPLTPIADYHFFRHPKKTRVVVNIGGITNITILRAGIESQEEVVGFDTGFGNMVLDGMAKIITGGKRDYDKDGRLAQSGKVREEYLKIILSHPFFKKKPPKSAGREEFGAAYLEQLQKRLKIKNDQSRKDLIASLTAAIPLGVKRSLNVKADEVLLCGGGAKNPELVKRFVEYMKPAKIKFTDEYGVPADAREAMAFALLGYLFLKREPGNIRSVTGATKSVILGKAT